MKLINAYILDVIIILILSVFFVLNIIQNDEYNKFLQRHYETVAKIKDSAFTNDSIMNNQNENTKIKKESDNVYEITSSFTYSIPLIAFNDQRIVQNYIYVPEVQK